MPSFTLRARNFRAIEKLDWSPEGVCLLCGPNGAGKSTALHALRFLRTLFQFGHEAAFQAVGGQFFRRLGTPGDEPVVFELEVGDILWKLRLPMSSQGMKGTYGEELYHGGDLVFRCAMFDQEWSLGAERLPLDEVRCCAKVVTDMSLERREYEWIKPLGEVLSGIRIHDSYWLNHVQHPQQPDSRNVYLAENGRNLWSVLANWKSSPLRYKGQFEAVLSAAKKAFPELISTIEFDRGLTFLYPPGVSDPDSGLPPSRAAEGLLTGLLHLTAVIGAKSGGIVAIDEMENQLHPHAIRSLIETMRKQAEEKNLTVILTTHSPVVLNSFRDEPEQVYVFDRSRPDLAQPAAMTDLHSEEWLAQAKLGTLYDQLAFGAPAIKAPVP
ncbi:MAG: AAA family ATPase [Polyangiaceae bacterium]